MQWKCFHFSRWMSKQSSLVSAFRSQMLQSMMQWWHHRLKEPVGFYCTWEITHDHCRINSAVDIPAWVAWMRPRFSPPGVKLKQCCRCPVTVRDLASWRLVNGREQTAGAGEQTEQPHQKAEGVKGDWTTGDEVRLSGHFPPLKGWWSLECNVIQINIAYGYTTTSPLFCFRLPL